MDGWGEERGDSIVLSFGFGVWLDGCVCLLLCRIKYVGSRSLKRKEPHPKIVRLKSGSLHPRLTFGSPSLTLRSPYYKIVNFTRRGTGFGLDGTGPFLVPPLGGKAVVLRNR